MRLKSLLFMVLCIIFGIGIYQIKNMVNERERKLAQIEENISVVKQDLHILEADWAAVTSPERLKKYADKNLDLQPAKAHRIVSFDDIPEKLPQENTEGDSEDNNMAENETHKSLPDGFINSSLLAAEKAEGQQ